MTLLLLNSLHNTLVWPLGFSAVSVALIILWRTKRVNRPGSLKEQATVDFLMIIFASCWLVFNIFYTAQNVFVSRDPGIYTVAGTWLIDHHDLKIPVTTVFGDNPNVTAGSSGFGIDIKDESLISVQGLHMLPVLLGLIGRIVGQAGMLHVGPVFGGIAILSVYAFARLFLRPRWAALAAISLAVSLPFVYFSRDTYTEPLMMALIFGALGCVWRAEKNNNISLWLLAGIATGSGALLRADGYLLSLVVIGYATYLYLVRKNTTHVRKLYMLLIGILIPSTLGFLDALLLSTNYYSVHGKEITQQIILALTILFSFTISLFVVDNLNFSFKLSAKIRKKFSLVLAILWILISLLFVSRQLWYVGYDYGRSENYNSFVAMLQFGEGRTIDKYRTYSEQSMNWLAWYQGYLLVGLATAGVALMLRNGFSGKRNSLIPFFLLTTGTALVFLTSVGITPDQIWAMRRFLPITMPGLAIMASYALDKASQKKWPSETMSNLVTGIASLMILIYPTMISRPFLKTRIYAPQLRQIKQVCQNLPDNAAVLWLGDAGSIAVQATRSYCSVPVARAMSTEAYTLGETARSVYDNGKSLVVIIDGRELELLPENERKKLTTISSIEYKVIPSTLSHPPTSTAKEGRSLLMGRVGADGKIYKL